MVRFGKLDQTPGYVRIVAFHQGFISRWGDNGHILRKSVYFLELETSFHSHQRSYPLQAVRVMIFEDALHALTPAEGEAFSFSLITYRYKHPSIFAG